MKLHSITTRISEELNNEIKIFAEKNNIKFLEATRQIAKMMNINRCKKVVIQYDVRF